MHIREKTTDIFGGNSKCFRHETCLNENIAVDDNILITHAHVNTTFKRYVDNIQNCSLVSTSDFPKYILLRCVY